jgi:NAD(P)-dependent dehydrogenase (short-subunit alcohol dehydrogenase family)
MTNWTAADIGDQTGQTFVVTGANSGLGSSAARALAAAGASAATMAGKVEVRPLDLADLGSVRSFAADLDQVDVLVNNAGVMALPKGRTVDGFERQIGTNHLGHFALTGLLLPKITGRVVTLSSYVHLIGKINLDDLNWERRHYQRWGAYAQSKLANLMFGYELQRRLAAAGAPVKSIAAHPGYASTELQSHTESFQDKVMVLGNRVIAQSADMGALPELYAATVPSLRGGEFIGPHGRLGLNGYPKIVGSSKASKDEAVAAGLWSLSEELTGISYP